jgi:uncharacterized membrane protein YagU involved in acid resistance
MNGSAIFRGAAAGVAATGAMSLFLEAARRAGTIDREPPEIITENIEETVEAPVLPDASFRTRWIAVHVAFGAAMGGVFGLLRGRLPRNTLAAGALFGTGLWTTMYTTVLPVTRLYPKPDDDWKPRAGTIAAGHLVYGATLALAFDRSRSRYSSARRDLSAP